MTYRWPRVTMAKNKGADMKHLIYLSLTALTAACGLEAMDRAPETSGAELYGAYCAGCHGTDATGGDVIAGKRAPNLTTLSRRHGGDFPTAYVMSTIDGYARDNTHGPMPEFGELLGGDMASWTDENGTPTPTPAALLSLAEYLEGQQV